MVEQQEVAGTVAVEQAVETVAVGTAAEVLQEQKRTVAVVDTQVLQEQAMSVVADIVAVVVEAG